LDKVVLGWISLLPASLSCSLSSQCAGAFVTVQNVVTEEVRMRIIMRRFESSTRGGLWCDIENVIQSFVAHCDKTYCAKCCDGGSEGEDYHEMFLIKRGTFKEPVMWKKKLCSTSSLYWFFHVWSGQPRQRGGAAGKRVFPHSTAFEKDTAQGWRSSFSMPWSLLTASRSSTFSSKCGVASVTVPNVATEGERRRRINWGSLNQAQQKDFQAEENFQATSDMIILGTLWLCLRDSDVGSEEGRQFESSTKSKWRTFKQRIMWSTKSSKARKLPNPECLNLWHESRCHGI